MSLRAGMGILDAGEDYLSPEERERRARIKRQQAIARGLTPDWFRSQDLLCLPAGMRVAIIGGGFAGLAAAWYLNECGVRTTVFEATGRVGGRVETDASFVPGKVVETGAELIGENHPLWGILARRFTLGLVPLTDDDDYERAGLNARTHLNGADLTPSQKQALKVSLRTPLAAIGREGRAIHETEPWRSRGARGFDRISVADKLDLLLGPGPSLARAWFDFTLGNDNCAAVADQSYLGLLASVSAARMGDDPPGMLGYWMSTETHRCQGGNDLLASRIAALLPDVRLRTTADRVEIEPMLLPPVRITSSLRDASNAIRSQRDEDFDFAVLAAPPTVWSSIVFRPAFNPATRTLQHGPAVKFLTRYPTRFWEPAGLAPSVKSDELGSLWEGTDNQGTAAEFCLSVFSGGPFVLPATAYPSRVAALYPTGLPVDEVFVDWPSRAFIRTGYAVPGRGQVTTVSPNQLIPHRHRLYFAGEQTSSGFFGYMEGSLQSGTRAARDIVRRWAGPCPGAGILV